MSEERDGIERTEAPSPRWVAHVRDHAPWPNSRLLVVACSLLAGLIACRLLAEPLFAHLRLICRERLGTAAVHFDDMKGLQLHPRLIQAIWYSMPLLFLPAVVATLSGMAQVGGRMRLQNLCPSFDRFQGIRIFQHVFSGITGRAALTQVAVWCGLTACVVWWLADELVRQRAGHGANVPPDLSGCAAIPWRVTLRLAIALVGLGVLDYAWAWKRHLGQLRMTRAELAAELRETEGNALVRRRVRQLQLSGGPCKWANGLGSVDVVLVGSGRLAAAIRFVHEGRAILVAKAVGTIADSLQRAGKLRGAKVVRHAALARQVAKSNQVGSELPADLFGQIAKLVAVS
jgi:flagellar biosynthetic protein FlhB